ncbi:MAG: type II toxin-antitoxin system HicA family toxin [Methanomicrobia archaeon]|nr:type II toxin-antitoxin system HicA family toxin [Methanomicrobia archaeon]
MKFRPLPQHEVIKILETNGFQRVRSRKHITFKKRDVNGHVWTTWVPKHSEVSVFTLKYIIKQSGKSREEFWA